MDSSRKKGGKEYGEMKIGIIDVGGGLKGIYSTGILDTFLERGIHFDLAIGVSAGSANLASFLAKQKGRNYVFYVDYSFRRKYMSLSNFLFHGSVVDLDYVYGTLSNSGGEYPLDYDAFCRNPTDFLAVATDATTGEARYFEKRDMKKDDYDVCKASSCLPYFFKPYFVDGIPYYDGACSDPVPLKKAFERGMDKVLVILSRPLTQRRTAESDERIARKIRKRYPLAAHGFALRAKRYNETIDKALEEEKKGRVFLLAPETTFGVGTLQRKKESLKRLYRQGREDARKAFDFLLSSPLSSKDIATEPGDQSERLD